MQEIRNSHEECDAVSRRTLLFLLLHLVQALMALATRCSNGLPAESNAVAAPAGEEIEAAIMPCVCLKEGTFMVGTGRGKQAQTAGRKQTYKSSIGDGLGRYRRFCREIRAHRRACSIPSWVEFLEQMVVAARTVTLLHVARARLHNVVHLYRSS